MPSTVKFSGRSGTICTVGSVALIGRFKNHELEITQDSVDHTGPQDAVVYRTFRRKSASLRIDSFVPAAGVSADLAMVLAGTAVLVTSDLVGGVTHVGTYVISRTSLSASDDPDAMSFQMDSHGTFTLS